MLLKILATLGSLIFGLLGFGMLFGIFSGDSKDEKISTGKYILLMIIFIIISISLGDYAGMSGGRPPGEFRGRP